MTEAENKKLIAKLEELGRAIEENEKNKQKKEKSFLERVLERTAQQLVDEYADKINIDIVD